MWKKGVPFPGEGDQEAGSHSKCPSFLDEMDPEDPIIVKFVLKYYILEKDK